MEIENNKKNKNVESEEPSMEGSLLEGEENYSMENSQMIVLDEVGETFTHSDGQNMEDPSGIMEQQSAGEEVEDCMGESEEGGFGALEHYSTWRGESGNENEQNPDHNDDTETTPRGSTHIVDEDQNFGAGDENHENNNQAQESLNEFTEERNQNDDSQMERTGVEDETSDSVEIIDIVDNDSLTVDKNSETHQDNDQTEDVAANETTEKSTNDGSTKLSSREKSPARNTTKTTEEATKKTPPSSAKKTPNSRAPKFKRNRLSAAQRRRIKLLEVRKEQRKRIRNNKRKEWRESVRNAARSTAKPNLVEAGLWSDLWPSSEIPALQRSLEPDTISYPLYYYQNLPKPLRSPNPPRLRETFIPSNQTQSSIRPLFPGSTSRGRTNQSREVESVHDRLGVPNPSGSRYSDSSYPNKRSRRNSPSDPNTSPPQKRARPPDLRSRISSRPAERSRDNSSRSATRRSGTRGGRGSNSNQRSTIPPNNRERDRSNSNKNGQKPVEPSRVSAAIVQGSVSQTALTDTHLAQLKSGIIEAIMTLPKGTFIPRFLNSYLKLGAIIIVCAEKESREWLKTIITKIEPLNEGPPLRIVDPGTLGKVYKMELRVPGDPMEPSEVLRLIACQNQGLRSELWTVCGRSRKNSNGFTLIVEVDHNSYSTLKELDWQPYVGLSRASMGLLR